MSRRNWGSYLLGIGIAGSFDGIVFHQLLQWHSVVMHTDHHGMIFSDGVFHAATTVALIVGAYLLWTAGLQGAGRRFGSVIGRILIGGGAFNLVEGIVNHHLLQIHHVREGHPNELMYDLVFLASGVILIGIGMVVLRTHEARALGA